MITYEQVEKLVEKTGAGYEDAKAALETSGGDMLDAVILLERRNKLPSPVSGGAYSSKDESGEEKTGAREARGKQWDEYGHTLGETLWRFFRWCGKWIGKGNRNFLDIERRGELIVSLPVTALVLLLVFLFFITIPLLIIALFCGCRLSFRGAELGRDDVNRVMKGASDTAENVKRDIRQGFEK